jgi:Putative metal-binding motif
MRRAAVLPALALTLVLAAPASATRYASPNGSATGACPATAPCTLQHAVAVSTAGEEIVVAQGDYHVSAPANVSCSGPFDPANQATGSAIAGSDRFIHGVLGRPRPRIIGSAADCVVLNIGASGSARHLEVDGADTTKPEAYAMLVDGGGNATDIVTGGANGAATMRNGARLIDSALQSRPQDGAALLAHFGISPNASYISNVTALGKVIASAVSIGLEDRVEISCFNSIATVAFVAVNTSPVGTSSAQVTRNHCAGATSTSGPNTSTPNVGGSIAGFSLVPGDYHEAAGSPTIDAGALDASILPFPDIDGGSRTVGSSPDIGADESSSAQAIVDSGFGVPAGRDAVVTGSVVPGGVPTNAYVAYGPTTGYGSQTAQVSAGSGFGATPLTFTLTGLNVNAPYHYAIVGTNGNVVGEDRVITFPDADHDGWFANADCNDANAAVNPGAAEILGNAVDENCDGIAAPFPSIGATVTISVLFYKPDLTKITKLYVGPVPAGATVTVTCKSPKKASRATRCPFKRKTIAVRNATARVQLAKYFKRRKLAVKTRFEIRATKPATIGLVARFTTRKLKVPKKQFLCLPPGAKTPSKC